MVFVCALFLAPVFLRAHGQPTRLVRVLETPALLRSDSSRIASPFWHEPLIFWLRTHGRTLSAADGSAANLVIVVYFEFPGLKRKTPGPRLTQPAEPHRDAKPTSDADPAPNLRIASPSR